ncbi:MAG: choline dehydrogenase [Paracoccaceae bacterium]|nr:choline dehydrogenase [Paracoccaceae bacterium]
MTVTDSSYDFIIIGAGSAGSVVANRLSTDARSSVLLIEAGGYDRNPLVRLPMLMGRLFNSGMYNWNYHTEPVPNLNGRSLYWPRGKVLGGSSTINGMIYVRGNRHDFDRWAQMGLSGWSYDDVLPAFLRSESHVQRSDAFHSQSGDLTVCRARGNNPLFDVFLEAGRQAGYPMTDDFNGRQQEGFGRFDFNIKDGKRWSAASAFLQPVRRRPNLSIATRALVRRLQITGDCVNGVEFVQGQTTRTVRAEREVILCAGTVNSPQILMLSGIGPAEELRRHRIPVAMDLPGVGQNLQDHVDCVVAYECRQPVTLYKDLRADRLLASVARGLILGEGTATTFPYEAGAFLKTQPGLLAPDIQLTFMPALERTANLYLPNPFRRRPAEAVHGFSIRVGPLIPDSLGHIALRSPDPNDPPQIHPNYLGSEVDRKRLLSGIRIVRDVIGQPAFDRFRGRELHPGAELSTDEDLASWLKSAAMTTFHPVGTCKMGTDPMAVVDGRLRVRGLKGLRIADASVMPVITSGNTHAPTVMIGEQVSAFIQRGE